MKNKTVEPLGASPSEQEREYLLLQLGIKTFDAPLQKAIQAAAIPHWFDEFYLAEILNDPGLEKLGGIHGYIILTNISFVEFFPKRGYNIHYKSRDILLEQLWQTAPSYFCELNSRAATYCKHQINSQQDDSKPYWETELIYHQLLAQAPNASSNFVRQIIWWQEAFGNTYSEIESLIRNVLKEVESKRLDGRPAAWGYYFQSQLDIDYCRTRDAKENLSKSLPHQEINSILRASCIKQLGDIHILLAEYQSSRENYEEALSIFKYWNEQSETANTLQALGVVCWLVSDFGLARNYVTDALEIYIDINDKFGEARCLKILGDIYLEVNAISPEGIEYYADAERICSILRQHYKAEGNELMEANSLKLLGDIGIQLVGTHSLYNHLHSMARLYYQQAHTLYTQLDKRYEQISCLKGIANAERFAGELVQAEGRFNEVLQFEKEATLEYEIALSLYYLGNIAEGKREFDIAKVYYESALEKSIVLDLSRIVKKIGNAIERLTQEEE